MKPLTERQAQIAELVARGLPDKQIAQETGLAIDTVRHHIQAAAARLPGDTTPRHKLIVLFLGGTPD
jgi:DNA-binding NarL/FixJ family response regulator